MIDVSPPSFLIQATRSGAGSPATQNSICVVLFDASRKAEPYPALLIPGRSYPTVFPSIAAALAAKQQLEDMVDA